MASEGFTRRLLIVNAYKDILHGLGYDLEDPNIKDTPDRVTDYMLKTIGMQDEQIREQTQEQLKAKFPDEYRGMVIMQDIKVYSLCPHHLLPIQYTIDAAYIPEEDMIGLSKIPRIIELLTRTLTLQEKLTDDIADVLYKDMESQGSMVIVKGIHGCVTMRGVQKKDCTTTTSSCRGVFAKPPEGRNPREEFLELTKR